MSAIQDFVGSVNVYTFTAISFVAVICVTWFAVHIVFLLFKWVKDAALMHSLGRKGQWSQNSLSWGRSIRSTAPWRNGRW